MGDVNLQEFSRTLGEMISRAANPRKPLTIIGIMMRSEMQENIRVGGRPDTWIPSKRAIREGGQTLADSGTLLAGIVSVVDDTSVAAGPTMMGKNHVTDPDALALLAYGGDVVRYPRTELFVRERKNNKFTGRTNPGRGATIGEHTAHYPKRDYTYIPPERFVTFGDIIEEFLLG
jgi:hypothetical protein